MAQVTDRNIGANPTGFDMRTEINNIIAALESDNSGASEPLNTVPYMKWLDTSNATYYYYKERNHDNTAWMTLFRYTVATKIMEVVNKGTDLTTTLASKAPLASPAFTGTPLSTTPANGDNSTKIATTAFVQANYKDAVVGSIVAIAHTTIPTGYLECNGALLSRSVYSALFEKIGVLYGSGNGSTTFAIPDLRGEFLRGWDNSRGIDSGRVVGSLQLDALQGHAHTISVQTQVYGSNGINAGNEYGSPNSTYTTNGIVTDSKNGIPRVEVETRPRNVSVMYCIKY